MPRARDIKKKIARRQALRKAHWNRTYVVLGVSVVLILLFYGNTLANGFVHDDIGQIVLNKYVQSLQYLPKVVTGCIWEYELGDCLMYYRPVQTLSYLIWYQFSSEPLLFHILNLTYFAIAVFLVFLFIKKLTGNIQVSFLTAVFFLVHPINSEVVNWISAVPELTFTIFVLLSAIFYISWRQSGKKAGRISRKKFNWKDLRFPDINQASSLLREHKKLLLSVLFYFAAMLSKEPAALLPLLFVFFDLFLLKIPLKKFFSLGELQKYGLFLATLAAYLISRVAVLGGIVQGADYYGVFSVPERLYASVTLFGQYLLKLVMPYPLVFFYPFEKKSSFASLEFFASFLVVLVFLWLIYAFLKQRKELLAFFLVWTAVFLAPVLIALESVGENVFSERYLFASTIGFAFLVSSGLVYLLKHRENLVRKAGIALVAVLVALSWLFVFPRNTLWKDDLTLYAATLRQNPDAHAIRRNLAVELKVEGRYDEALAELQIVVDRSPNWRDIDKVYNNFGDVYHTMGDLDKALFYYEKFAQTTWEGNYQPSNNRGAVLFEKGEYLESLTNVCKAAQINPGASEPRFNLNRLVSVFASVQDENLSLLRDDVVNGGVFQKSERERIRYGQRSCSDEGCSLLFASAFAPGEILFPFLVTGSTEDGKVFRDPNPLFDPATGTITIQADSKYENEAVTFIFPTCDGVYYEAATAI